MSDHTVGSISFGPAYRDAMKPEKPSSRPGVIRAGAEFLPFEEKAKKFEGHLTPAEMATVSLAISAKRIADQLEAGRFDPCDDILRKAELDTGPDGSFRMDQSR